jgi:excisionase family DNA binding protein
MGKITVAQAAKRLGTSKEVIQHWIDQGLLHAYPKRRYRNRRITSHPVAAEEPVSKSLNIVVAPTEEYTVSYIDEDELFEVAETIGWLMLTAETWEKDDDEG